MCAGKMNPSLILNLEYLLHEAELRPYSQHTLSTSLPQQGNRLTLLVSAKTLSKYDFSKATRKYCLRPLFQKGHMASIASDHCFSKGTLKILPKTIDQQEHSANTVLAMAHCLPDSWARTPFKHHYFFNNRAPAYILLQGNATRFTVSARTGYQPHSFS